MIMTFKHKGLQSFFLCEDSAKIQQKHVKRLRLCLAKLNTAVNLLDMNFPGSDLHPLKGSLKDFWSISISGNWRLVFRFKNKNAYDVDYLDYH
jgi:toxin HigB-1